MQRLPLTLVVLLSIISGHLSFSGYDAAHQVEAVASFPQSSLALGHDGLSSWYEGIQADFSKAYEETVYCSPGTPWIIQHARDPKYPVPLEQYQELDNLHKAYLNGEHRRVDLDGLLQSAFRSVLPEPQDKPAKVALLLAVLSEISQIHLDHKQNLGTSVSLLSELLMEERCRVTSNEVNLDLMKDFLTSDKTLFGICNAVREKLWQRRNSRLARTQPDRYRVPVATRNR